VVPFDVKSTSEKSHDIVSSDPRIFSHRNLNSPKYFEIDSALYSKDHSELYLFVVHLFTANCVVKYLKNFLRYGPFQSLVEGKGSYWGGGGG
jgi:hypothetical protein